MEVDGEVRDVKEEMPEQVKDNVMKEQVKDKGKGKAKDEEPEWKGEVRLPHDFLRLPCSPC